MATKRRGSDNEAENSGEAFQNDMDDLYGTPEDESEDEEDEDQDK
jgi:hypothetical protein